MATATPNPNIHWHNAATGETIERPMTEEEYAQFLSELPNEETRPE